MTVSSNKSNHQSTLTPTPVLWSYPLYCCPCTLPKFVYTSFPHWVSPAGCHGVSPLPTSCHVSFLPMLPCLSLLCIYGLGLCPCSGLVYHLLLRGGRGLSPDCTWPEEYLSHNLGVLCMEDTSPSGALALPTSVEGNHFDQALSLIDDCFYYLKQQFSTFAWRSM